MPRSALLIALVALGWTAPAQAVRIKDITDIQGQRSNQLVGFGLVVGLENTGGRSLFTQQVAVDMLRRFEVSGKTVSEQRIDNLYRSGNVAAVMITADLGPFNRRGSRIDVTVSVVDDATSLQGGVLIRTPLRGADGVTYAVAQGAVSLGGFIFSTPTGSNQPLASAQKNHPTVGRIPGGATIEREERGDIECNGQFRLMLREPDYNTSRGVADAINAKYPRSAITLDAGTIHVVVPPPHLPNLVAFVSEVGLLEVNPDAVAKVVINERTGTIVAGEQVKISRIAVSHGNLQILTTTDFTASQPTPFSGGQTTVLPQSQVQVNEQAGAVRVLEPTITVADLARALNALGVTTRDLITIFQSIKQAGALHAELVIM